VVRFRTDSKKIGIKAKFHIILGMQHMASSGADGFDLYEGMGKSAKLIKNMFPTDKKIDQTVETDGVMKDYTIYFPLYAGVDSVKIGLDKDAKIESATPHKIKLPFLYYGSSITQGGCASRPGNCYTALVAREFDAPMINMGFSGSAMGEEYMSDMISEIPMSVFFLDYDYNATSPEHLEKTHYKFYKKIRNVQPDISIVMMSGVRSASADISDAKKRKEIIISSFERAKAEGDSNVYFVDGLKLFGDVPADGCTVELCHPTDLGFYLMAQGTKKVVNEFIYKI